MCVDPLAVEECEWVVVGNVYHEAIKDALNQPNFNPEKEVILLINRQPFYVKREYLTPYDTERDETRQIITNFWIFLN